MSQRIDHDALLEAVMRERDSALEEAKFERLRADQAMQRYEVMRRELSELREHLRHALANSAQAPEPAAPAGPSAEERDLTQRLHLAMDTIRRLEKDRVRMERELEESRSTLTGERDEIERLRRRLRALEGALRIAQG